MKTYNLVIKCPRCVVKDDEKLLEFVEERLHEGSDVDYFGGEIDNHHDYVDDILLDIINTTTYITIHFNHPVDISKDEALKVLKDGIRKRKIQVSATDEKDVEVLFIT